MENITSKIKSKTSIFDNFLFGIFLLAILAAPFYRGLYFEKEQHCFIFTVGTVLLIYLIKGLVKREVLLKKSDYALGALVLIYILSILYSSSIRGAYIDSIRWASLFLIFIYIRNKTYKEKDLLKEVLIFGGLATLFVGVLAMMGTEVMKGVGDIHRLFGVIQYPNSYMAYLAAMIFLCLGTEEGMKKKLYHRTCSFLFFFGVIFTFSRLGWVVLAFVYMAGLIFSSRGKKADFALDNFIYISMAVVASLLFIKFSGKAWLQVISLLGMLIANLVIYKVYYSKREELFERLTENRKAIFALIGISGIMFIYLLFETSNPILRRIQTISWEDGSWQTRLDFYKTALKMTADSNWLGLGGGAWEAGYKAYRDYEFSSNEVHSSIFSLLVEVGVIGLLLYLIFALKIIFKGIRDKGMLTIALAAMVIFLHSFFDFNMEIYFSAIILFSILALIDDRKIEDGNEKNNLRKKVESIALIALCSGCLLLSGIFIGGESYARRSDEHIRAKDLGNATVMLQKASDIDFLNPSYYKNLSKLYHASYMETKDKAYLASEKESFGRFIDLAPDNVETNFSAVRYYLRMGNFKKALTTIDRAVELDPQNLEVYLSQLELYKKLYTGLNLSESMKRELLDYYYDGSNINSAFSEYDEEKNIKKLAALKSRIEKYRKQLASLNEKVKKQEASFE